MTPDRIEAVIRTTEIFKKHIRPGQPVIYLAEASGPIEGRSFADLDKLTYTVGMDGESEILTFRETVALFDWLFTQLDQSAAFLRTGAIPPAEFQLDENPSDQKIVETMRRVRLSHSRTS
jgi:hypothetical protein